jgi:flagellar biosynthesis protein FlhF
VRDELNPGELADEGIVRSAVLRHLSGLIPIAEAPRPVRGADGRPHVVALVGPTGVGKTTTIAKLAATYRLRQGRSVALITADTYRIAAVDQLRTYASIIGLPLKVVLTPGEMSAAVDSLSAHDVVLIDTAGRSQRNTERLAELSDFLSAARPSETHLVLSTAAAQEVLISAAESFGVLRPNRVILTKLDEAVNFGVVVNVMQRLQSQLSFVTTGQEVPDHIEPGRADRLARMILEPEWPSGRGESGVVRDDLQSVGRVIQPLAEARL